MTWATTAGMGPPTIATGHEGMLTEFVVNGRPVQLRLDPRRHLADVLRQDLGLVATHLGCEHGVCGSCTVRVDGDLVRSCLMLGVQADGTRVETVEGLAGPDHLHPVQQGFAREHGLQCGFCTPGFLMATLDLLERTPHPTDEEIREHLSGNICRCTGYVNIVKAVRWAAEHMPAGDDG